MEAGREMDALVAEKVMGWEKVHNNPVVWGDSWYGIDGDALMRLPHYSTDIAAAWQVVEKVIAGDEYEIGFENGQHYAKLGSAKGGYAWAGQATGTTAPHAICLAALKAVGALE